MNKHANYVKKQEEAAEIIRDVIDYSEYIYDDMDSKLKDLLQEKGLM